MCSNGFIFLSSLEVYKKIITSAKPLSKEFAISLCNVSQILLLEQQLDCLASLLLLQPFQTSKRTNPLP